MNCIASWSGGKDSCLALYRAGKMGYRVVGLLNLVSKKHGRCCFHGVDSDLIKLQADLIGLPLFQEAVTDDMQQYEKDFKSAVLQFEGIEGMIFGDIYLEEHKEWVERVCRDLGIEAIEPLWNEPPLKVAEDFIGAGFQAVVVSCQADKFGQDFVGRRVDRKLVSELEERNICPCGENGEFHTLVVDGPLFKRGIEILEAEPMLRDGFWKHWSLDIKKYR